MLPLVLDLRGKSIVVFGGGEVGLRKAAFLSREAEVTIISREFAGECETARMVREDISASFPEWIEGADMVVAATDDPRLNSSICREARARGKPCNQAHGPGDFLIPSTVERGGITVAVTTGGRSPAVTRRLALEIDAFLGERWPSMVALQEELRSRLKESGQDSRARVLRAALDDEEVWELLEVDPEGALRRALSHLEDGR
ncbi:MAG: bifunctional precorrin-2 dehydrogenase/sirohydrochlorin ferrochelatase [Methanomassiliicoccales archaeon]